MDLTKQKGEVGIEGNAVESEERDANSNSTNQRSRNVTPNHSEAAIALSSTFTPSPSRVRLTTISPIGSSGLLSPNAKANSTTSDSEFFRTSSDDQHRNSVRPTTALSVEEKGIADLTSSRELELNSEQETSKRKVEKAKGKERFDHAEEVPSITVSLNDFASSKKTDAESFEDNERTNSEQKGTSKSPKIPPTEAVDFLTKRLRSAIGQEILLQDNDDDDEEIDEDSEMKGSIHVQRPAPARSESKDSKSKLTTTNATSTNGKEAATSSSTAWGWSTLTNLPASLRIDQALQSLSLRGESNEGACTSKKEDQKAKVSSDPSAVSSPASDDTSPLSKGNTLGKGFISAVDPRNWFGAGEKEGVADASKITSNATQSQSDPPPFHRIPTGSFPASSSVASRKKKERENVKGKAQEMEQASAASLAETKRKEAVSKVEEHDLREEGFGIPDEDLERYGGERYPAHEYLILSTAGKPVFWSKISKARLIRTRIMRQRRRTQQAELDSKRAKGEDVSKEAEATQAREERFTKEEQSIQDEEDQMEATRVGLLQAIISNYAENDRKKLYETSAEVLELPKTGKTTFLLRPPLYLVAVSHWDEADSTLRNHLEYLHQAVISLVSASKLNKLFDRAANFDLKRLLQGTDNILDSLLTRLQLETIAMRGALQPLRLNAAIRHDVGAALIPTRSKQTRPQDALYAVLLTRNGIVTLARRRKHSIHPVDCHLLVNTVLSTNALKEGGTQSWVPICLPKFAPQGFLYAHVSFLDDEAKQEKNDQAKDVTSTSTNRHPDLGLVLVTANPDGFDDMSAWRDRIVGLLQENKMFKSLLRTARSKEDENTDTQSEITSATKSTFTSIRYSADELGIAGLRHFCFKWRSNVQSTSSSYEDPYTPGTDDHRRLLYLYGLAHEYVIKSAKENVKAKKAGADKGSTDVSPALSEAEFASRGSGKGDGGSSETDDASSVHTTNTLGRKSVVSQKQANTKSATSNTPIRSSSPPIVPRSVLLSPKAAAASSQSPSSSSIATSAAGLLKQSMGIGTSQTRSTTSTHVIRTQNEAILAWSTPPFELYICASPHVPNQTLINMAKTVVKWVKQEEHQLFIVSAPIF